MRLFIVVTGPYETETDLRHFWGRELVRDRYGWRTLAREVLRLKRKAGE